MNAIVVGCGSIGRRHINNLGELGIRDFCFCDPDKDRIADLVQKYNAKVIASVDELGDEVFDLCLICSPSSMHVEHAVKLVSRCKGMFIEKPIAHSLDGIGLLIDEAKKNNIINMTGMCYQFNPTVLKVKELVRTGEIGKVYCASICLGHYLPNWHPNRDYTQEYSAMSSMGGGALLTTGSHALDMVRFLFGDIIDHKFYVERLSDLKIDVDDCTAGIIKTANGVFVSCQLDFLHIPKTSTISVVGSKGKVECDLLKESVSVDFGDRSTKFLFKDSMSQMYKNEMRYFVNSVASRSWCASDFENGLYTLKHLMDIKKG